MIQQKATDDKKRQIVRAINTAVKSGYSTKDACKRNGMSIHNFYNWKKRFAGIKNAKDASPVSPVEINDYESSKKIVCIIGTPQEIAEVLLKGGV